jgi:hypothetical protein
MERKIPDETWAPLAQSLNVSVAALRAVAAVESAGDGFLVAPPELPKILFEGHAFHRLTQHARSIGGQHCSLPAGACSRSWASTTRCADTRMSKRS